MKRLLCTLIACLMPYNASASNTPPETACYDEVAGKHAGRIITLERTIIMENGEVVALIYQFGDDRLIAVCKFDSSGKMKSVATESESDYR